MTPKLYLTVGISGSGKSTQSRNFQEKNPDVQIVCPDKLRSIYAKDINDMTKDKFIQTIAKQQAAIYLLQGHDVIFDATNLNIERNKKLIKDIKQICNIDFQVYYKVFYSTWEESYFRITKDLKEKIHRSNVPLDSIVHQSERFQNMKPQIQSKYVKELNETFLTEWN